MDKFGRRYELKIQTDDLGSMITVALPFTIEFDIIKNTLTSANICQIRIFNLSQKNRDLIRFNISDYGQFRAIQLRAGYGKNLPLVFTGNISTAWSVREGVNMITQIECYDGGFAFVNGTTEMSFISGTSNRDVISSIAQKGLPGVSVGAIGDYPGDLPRGASYNGNTMSILGELTGGGAFISDGRLNALGTNEYLLNANGITLINAQSGLLGTPVLEQTIVRFDMLFEPNLLVGQAVKLESITEKNFNGEYKVTAVKHRGMISEAVCGDAITTGEFFYTKLLEPVADNG